MLSGIPSQCPNSLDPDQDRHSVGPDLGPNCLKGYQQTTKVATSKERVKLCFLFEQLFTDVVPKTCENSKVLLSSADFFQN